MSKRDVNYTRGSADSQTVANQQRDLDAVAEWMGWIIVEQLADEGISGAKGWVKRLALRSANDNGEKEGDRPLRLG